MTEAEWLASSDPMALFKHLKCRFKHRKMRLFAVACCRRISPQLSDQRSLQAIDVAERHADGLASDRELRRADDAARRAHDQAYHKRRQKEELDRRENDGPDQNMAKSATCLEWAAASVAGPFAWKAAQSVRWMSATPRAVGAATGAEYPIQADLVRDIFGNPFHPVTLDPTCLTWNDGAVTKLAQAIYEQRAFEKLPDLAGVLEAAGCCDPYMIAHCRHPGPHVRGCCVVDVLVGKV